MSCDPRYEPKEDPEAGMTLLYSRNRKGLELNGRSRDCRMALEMWQGSDAAGLYEELVILRAVGTLKGFNVYHKL